MKLNKKGFTLIELLGVIVIIGLIIAGTTYGLIKLIERSKEDKTNISISSIKEGASVYANEKNNDESYWKKMIREDIKGSYFCVTIEELQNKGLLDKNIDFDSLSKGKNPIKKTTYVGIKKDETSKVNSNPTLLNNAKICNLSSNNCSKEDILYGVCTGNILNEEIKEPPKLENGDSYTDRIINLTFKDIESKNNVKITIKDRYCLYTDKDFSQIDSGTKVEASTENGTNTCNLSDLKQTTDYHIKACITTEGGSISCSQNDYKIKTKTVKKPSITLSDKVNITYNTDNIKGEAYYYFKSTISGTSNINVSSCTLNNNIFTCNNDSTTSITKDVWYKSPNTNISISYSTSGTGTVYARTYDKSNNFNESSKEFSVYKITFNKGTADKIGGGTSNITKMCLTEKNGSCNITSPSIEKAGYTAVGWNTDSSASTSTWNAGASKSINSSGTYYPITKKNIYYAIIRFNTNGGKVTPSITTDSGNVYKWKADSNGLISRTNANGSTYSTDFFKIAYGAQTSSDGLVNYSNSKYLKITKTGYSAVTDAEWKCMSGCTTTDKTFNQDSAYSSSDFCDAQNGNCTVVLGVNWTANKYTISYSLGDDAKHGANHPTSALYNESKSISNPTRTGYKFTGWKITGMDSTTHTYGSNTTNSTSISSTKATSFKNLRSTSGTVTFTAQWECAIDNYRLGLAATSLANLVENEVGKADGTKYDGGTDSWCGNFAVWAIKNTKMCSNTTKETTLYNYLKQNGKITVQASGLWPAFKGTTLENTHFYLGKAYGGTYTPKVGDIVWFQWQNGYCRNTYGRWDKKTVCSDHVEVVTGVSTSKNKLYSVGGCAGDECKVKSRTISLDAEEIIAFGTFYK